MISSPRKLALSLIAGGVLALVAGTLPRVPTGVAPPGLPGQVPGPAVSQSPRSPAQGT